MVLAMAVPQLKRIFAKILKTLNVPPGRKLVEMSLVQNSNKMNVIEKIQGSFLVLIAWTKHTRFSRYLCSKNKSIDMTFLKTQIKLVSDVEKKEAYSSHGMSLNLILIK